MSPSDEGSVPSFDRPNTRDLIKRQMRAVRRAMEQIVSRMATMDQIAKDRSPVIEEYLPMLMVGVAALDDAFRDFDNKL